MGELLKKEGKNQSLVSKQDITSVDLASLEPSRVESIMSIKESIELTYNGSINYASAISKNMTDFSTALLKSVKVKDVPEVEEPLMELLTGLKTINPESLMEQKQGFFKRLFKTDEISDFITRTEDISSLVDKVKEKLEVVSYSLDKDIELCRHLLEQNNAYGLSLDNHIIAGRIKLNEARQNLKEEEAKLDPTDIMAMNEFNYHSKEIDRFDRKLYSLYLMRNLVAQNIPKITLIMDGDSILIEKIQDSINSAIPAWETQMVLSIQLLRQKGALAIQKAVTKTTNEIIERNNAMLKGNAIEIAEELEKGIIDPKVLKKSNQDFIEILEAMYKIRQKGKEDRDVAIQELSTIQLDLNNVLLRLNSSQQ